MFMKKDFAFIDAQRLRAHLSMRHGEVKIGERVVFAANSIEESLSSFNGKYVLLGLEEDIGPRANGGYGGAINAFKAFLSKFLNMQANHFMRTENLMILGRAKFECVETGFESLRVAVEEIDDFLVDILIQVYAANKIPIIVGGGHNNAYPLIKAYFLHHKKAINVMNLDPHADFRALEGRHSGNSFSYAIENGYLANYFVHGIHKQYNSENMLRRMEEFKVDYTCFEDYLDEKRKLIADARAFVDKHKEPFGVELDLDSIADMPTSAMTPMGWSLFEARQWLRQMIQGNTVYYNFTEGAPELHGTEYNKVGKALAYFVSDLIEK